MSCGRALSSQLIGYMRFIFGLSGWIPAASSSRISPHVVSVVLVLSGDFGIELSSQEVPLQVLSSIYNVSQLSSRWISVGSAVAFGDVCELAHPPLLGSRKGVGTYFEKIKALQAQFILMNITAWNNTIGLLT